MSYNGTGFQAPSYLIKKAPPDVRVGDSVKFTATGKVTHLVTRFGIPHADLDNGLTVNLSEVTAGKTVHELIKRPKPVVGSTLTPDEIRAHMWKRGTMIQMIGLKEKFFRILYGDGKWYTPQDDPALGEGLAFESLIFDYILVFDPDAK